MSEIKEVYEIEDPEALVNEIQELRRRILCDGVGEIARQDFDAEQYILLAIAALDQAQRFAQLAEYKLRQARVAR